MDRRTLVTCDLMKTGHFCRGLLGTARREELRLSVRCNARAAGSECVVGFSKATQSRQTYPATSAPSLLPSRAVPYQSTLWYCTDCCNLEPQ